MDMWEFEGLADAVPMWCVPPMSSATHGYRAKGASLAGKVTIYGEIEPPRARSSVAPYRRPWRQPPVKSVVIPHVPPGGRRLCEPRAWIVQGR